MSSETPARKHKKAKDTSADTSITHDDVDRPRKAKKAKLDKAAVTADATNDPESTSVVVKEKKHKKRKHTESAVDSENEDGSVAMEPKKKKKRKHEETGEEVNETVDAENSRKKKSKKAAGDAEVEDDVGSARRSKRARRKEAEAKDDAAPSALPEVSPKKSKKDKRKKRTREGEEGEDASMSEPAPPSAKPEKKKKRKRRSESGFPDPSEDETLNEQAQKALQYAFSQFDDPSSWKFNKARQNWLIRNVWAEESIPEVYMPLVTRYLQGVQGGVRETLIKTCREAMEAPSGEPAPASGEAEDAQKAADAEDASPAKKTVKFAVEAESSPAQSNETKRQRATALLDALTSHTS